MAVSVSGAAFPPQAGSSPPRSYNASSPQALCVNAKRCPHGAQAAKRPERGGGSGEGSWWPLAAPSSPPRRQARPPVQFEFAEVRP